MKKNWIVSAVAGLSMMASGAASAIVVGGVDFGALGTIEHIETTTLAETFINADGQELIGYGQVNTVNGNLLYAGTDRLYFTFSNYISDNFSASSVDFSGGLVNVYIGPTFNLLDQDSPTNLATISGLTPWVTLAGHSLGGTPYTLSATGILTGGTLSFTGAGLLDVIGGIAEVVAFLDSNGVPDGAGGFADIAITTSGNNNVLNPHDVEGGLAEGCQDGTAAPGAWCFAGSADLRGPTALQVPEPGALALLGVGLLGLGASSLRRRNAA